MQRATENYFAILCVSARKKITSKSSASLFKARNSMLIAANALGIEAASFANEALAERAKI